MSFFPAFEDFLGKIAKEAVSADLVSAERMVEKNLPKTLQAARSQVPTTDYVEIVGHKYDLQGFEMALNMAPSIPQFLSDSLQNHKLLEEALRLQRRVQDGDESARAACDKVKREIELVRLHNGMYVTPEGYRSLQNKPLLQSVKALNKEKALVKKYGATKKLLGHMINSPFTKQLALEEYASQERMEAGSKRIAEEAMKRDKERAKLEAALKKEKKKEKAVPFAAASASTPKRKTGGTAQPQPQLDVQVVAAPLAADAAASKRRRKGDAPPPPVAAAAAPKPNRKRAAAALAAAAPPPAGAASAPPLAAAPKRGKPEVTAQPLASAASAPPPVAAAAAAAAAPTRMRDAAPPLATESSGGTASPPPQPSHKIKLRKVGLPPPDVPPDVSPVEPLVDSTPAPAPLAAITGAATAAAPVAVAVAVAAAAGSSAEEHTAARAADPPKAGKPAPAAALKKRSRSRAERKKNRKTKSKHKSKHKSKSKPKSAYQRAVERTPDGKPDIIIIRHADFMRRKVGSVMKQGSMPNRKWAAYLKKLSTHKRRTGPLNPQIYTIQQSEQYTSATNTRLQRSKRQISYDCKSEPIGAIGANQRAVPADVLPVMGPDGKWRRITSPAAREYRRLRQRDTSAVLVQAYALYQFMLGKPRPDVLSFKSEVELRARYAEHLGDQKDDHAAALKALVDEVVAKNAKQKKQISPASVAKAIYGVCKL